MYEKYEAKLSLQLGCEVVALQNKFTYVSIALISVNIKKIKYCSIVAVFNLHFCGPS